ncbi:hypothetical protein [Arthrobacter sp. HLT1-20]
MAIFKRKTAAPEAPDSELTFFTESGANECRETVHEVFAELGLDVTMHPGHAVDASGRRFGFWNVAAACHERPRRAWRGVIRKHLQRVLASFNAPDPFDNLAPANVATQTSSAAGKPSERTGQSVREDFGWLMSIPNRHQVVWHIIKDATVVAAVNAMAHFTALGYSDSAGPISPHVFWWNGRGYEQLTHMTEDGGLTIQVSPAFQAVVEAVAEGR